MIFYIKKKEFGLYLCLKIINLKSMWIVKVEELGIKTDDGISFLKGLFHEYPEIEKTDRFDKNVIS